MKDAEIINKFCTPKSFPLQSAQTAQTEAEAGIEVPPLVSKLIEVEYMLQGKEQPANSEQ
jgi:hypothetical protein